VTRFADYSRQGGGAARRIARRSRARLLPVPINRRVNPLAASLSVVDERGTAARAATEATRISAPVDRERALGVRTGARTGASAAIEGGRATRSAPLRELAPEPSAEILAGFRARDEAALAPVHAYFCERLVIFARIYLDNLDDAEEAMQGAFLKVWNAPKPIPDEVSVREALYQATQSEALDIRKREWRRARLLGEHIVLTPPRRTATPEDHAHAALLLAHVLAAAEHLPKRMRHPFWLHWHEGFDYAEIGRTLGLGHRVVQKYVLQAYRDVKALLESRGATP
jgi:RNA polymerase sigma factor (sigma-70 family)